MRIFLKTHTESNVSLPDIYSVQLAFIVLEPIFVVEVFKKLLFFVIFKKMVFLQKNLGSIFLQKMFSKQYIQSY